MLYYLVLYLVPKNNSLKEPVHRALTHRLRQNGGVTCVRPMLWDITMEATRMYVFLYAATCCMRLPADMLLFKLKPFFPFLLEHRFQVFVVVGNPSKSV